ncbi:hypothetical protein SLA2020_378740 [Shorea laevis]
MTDPVTALVLPPLIEKLLSIAASSLRRRIGQFWNSGNLKEKLKKLKEDLTLIESVHKCADQMQSDIGTREWQRRLQDYN